MAKKPKRPRDPNEFAKFLTDVVTGNKPNDKPDPNINEGQRKGGEIGGPARAEKLTAAERKKIASKAAKARWKKR